MSPEQMRKKSLAQDEAERHHKYSAVDGERREMNTQPMASMAIKAAGREVKAATMKEDRDIGGQNASPNDDRY